MKWLRHVALADEILVIVNMDETAVQHEYHSWADVGDTGGVDGRLMMQVLTPFNLEDESDGCSSSHWFR